MQKEDTTEEIIEGLQKQHSNKFKFLIIIFSVIGIIIFLALLISAYFYFKTPEKTLGIGANIESSLLSQDGTISYIKLTGGSLDKNITKIKFIFTDENGQEYFYETSEGIRQIEVPFKRSFWQWLFGKPAFSGKYDYEINSGDIGLNDFLNINEISVSFEYKTETGETIETPKLDTEKTTSAPKPTPSPGGGGGPSGPSPQPEPTPTCTDSDAGINYYEKGATSYSTTTKTDNCSDNILVEYYCNGSLIEEVNYNCSVEGKVCADGKCIEIRECTDNENCSYLNNECSYGICNVGNCEVAYNVSGTVCSDNLFCTENDVCNVGVCQGILKDCSDAIACTEDVCNEALDSCENIINNTKCNYPAEICDKIGGCIGNACYGIDFCSNYMDSINCTLDSCDVGICQWNETSGQCEEAPGECNNDADCLSKGPGFICNETNSQCEWKPPIGIPRPEFGIEETYRMYDNVSNRNPNLTYTQNSEGGFYTHYVDNTDPNATDTSNPYGTESKPRMTIPTNLVEGSVVEIHGENYGNNNQADSFIVRGTGTKEKSVFIRGVSDSEKPVFTGLFSPRGSYVIVENLYLYHTSLFFIIESAAPGPIHHIALRNSEFEGTGVSSRRDAIGIHTYTAEVPNNIIIYNNHIHHYGDYLSTSENDAMGVGVLSTQNVWIVDNHIHHNGGDSIQVQSNFAKYIYIGRNIMHENREQAVDIKQSEHVIISENEMYGFVPVTTAAGDAVAVHYTPTQNIWITHNHIYDSQVGISLSTGPTTVYIADNIIHNITGSAISFWNNGKVYAVGNTIYDTGGGISGTTSTALYAFNNIIANLNLSNYNSVHLGVWSPAMAATSNASYNLFYQKGGGVRINWGGGSENYYNFSQFKSMYPDKSEGCIEAEPLFVDAANNNFNLLSGSPAMDSGIESEVYQRFYDLYGIDIRKDIEGRIRPQDGDNNGSAEWDIGAYEYSGSVGGTSASLSPFTKLLNFLKGLLTRKTGKAILTGKIITGNVVNENGESKVSYIVLSLLVMIILIIVIIIVKIKKNKKKSNKRKLKRLRIVKINKKS